MADAKLGLLILARDEASAVLRTVGVELGVLDEKASTAKGFEQLGTNLSGIAKTAAGFALGGLALNLGGDIAGQFKEVLTNTVELGRGVRRLQLDIGGSAESISGLLAVFHRFGVEGEGAERTLSLFSRGLRGDLSATEASTQNAKTFSGTLAELGVESTDAQGRVRPMTEVLLEVADGFKAHINDGQNAARAMALFGRSGRDLVPALVQGRDGILELEAEAQKLGLTLSQGNVDSVRQFVRSQKDMGEAVEGLKIQLGVALLPVFVELAKAGADWAKSLNAEGGASMKQFGADAIGLAKDLGELVRTFGELDRMVRGLPNPGRAGSNLGNALPGAEGKGLLGAILNQFGLKQVTDFIGDELLRRTGHEDLVPVAPATPLQRQTTEGQDARDAVGFAREKAAAEAEAARITDGETSKKRQLETIDKQIAEAERQSAQVQHDIALQTRENLDMKRSEAEIQLAMLPLKEQQAEIEQQLLMATDKRAGLERDAAVARAQQASNASADALEGLNFEERRLKLKIQSDALAGRGVAAGDVAALMKLGLSKPGAELDALLGGRPVTLAERDRQRAQQAQDLATIPIRQKAAEIESNMASLKAQSDAVQREIEEARLHGVIDTTDLQKKKQLLDDQLFEKKQTKADLTNGVVVNVTQNINTGGGDIDYNRVIEATQTGVLGALNQASANVSMPAPAFTPGSRGVGTLGPF